MKRGILSICIASAVLATLAGCATPDGKSTSSSSTMAVTASPDQQKVIDQQQSRISSLEAELRQKDNALQSRSKTTATSGSIGLFPPDAQPGHCYARVLIPATWGQTTETVLVREASERIMVRPESKRYEEVPATYKTVSVQVMISPARTEWKRGPASSFADTVVQSRTTGTGEVMCLVEIPAQYQTVTRKVVDRPASTREVLCQVNMTGGNIRTLQTSLRNKGYDVGPVDGVLGKKTLVSANSYAKSSGLPYGSNYIAIETAEKLGLSL